MSIFRMNEIGRNQGREAALAYAIVSKAPYRVRKLLEDGVWDFDGKATEVSKPAAKPKVVKARYGQPINKMRPRVGKTARKGGLAASQKRKREKAEASRQIRANMKG